MPTSELRTSPLRSSASEVAYRAARADFMGRHVAEPGWDGAIQAFHAVRNMRYFSGPDRTPLAALRSGQGACTAKHLILRDLLRDLGLAARVELVACDFAAAVPPAASMPASLRAMIERGNIRDFHCWIRAGDPAQGLLLDATWPDQLADYGFPVNADWDGTGDTRAAVANGVVRCDAEDVLARKEALLAELTQDEADARKAFLAGLSAWLKELPADQGGDRE